ncbi:hypothetical protein [Lacrimispora sp.]|uniref:hypothetical protein n=1 Tax=Lacrimispora sp. TaxID=2719234 RepID=UPI003460E721
MIRQMVYEETGRKKLAEGIRELCRVLACDGAILVNGSYTMSAAAAARHMEGEDLYMNQGIRLAAGAIAEINARTGCGTKEAASMLLSQVTACEQAVCSGINPVYLSREIRKAADWMADAAEKTAIHQCAHLGQQLIEITGDEELAEMVLQAMEAGQVIIKDSMQVKTRMEVIKGMTVNGQLLAGRAATLKGVEVLVTSRKLSSFSDLLPLLEKLGNRPLFLVADEIEGEALTLLKTNMENRRIAVWAVKAPGIGKRKEDMLADLAVLTGTRVYGEYDLLSWKELSPEMLGMADTIEAAAAYSVVEGRTSEASARRIAGIHELIEDPKTNFYDQQVLRERIAWLSGQVPVIYAGGETTVKVKEEKLRLEYAAAYAQSVKKYGMLRSGFADGISAETAAEKIVLAGMRKSLSGKEVSAGLFVLLLRKITSLTAMWLTTGAVMVSTGYDREDRELMESGVDVERLRGSYEY